MAPVTEKLLRVQMLACDVDGVLTDGAIAYGSEHLEIKAFNIKDGMAMSIASVCDFPVVWITGRRSEAVTRRADELQVRVYQGVVDKERGLRNAAEDCGLAPSAIAYLGDDLNDLPALRIAGLPCAVADSAADVLHAAAYVTQAPGGGGAVREVIELIFRAQQRWDEAVARYLASLRDMHRPA